LFALLEKAISYSKKVLLKLQKAIFFEEERIISVEKRGNILPKSFLIFLYFGGILPYFDDRKFYYSTDHNMKFYCGGENRVISPYSVTL